MDREVSHFGPAVASSERCGALPHTRTLNQGNRTNSGDFDRGSKGTDVSRESRPASNALAAAGPIVAAEAEERGISMTATIKAAISRFAQAKTEFDSNPMHFLNEDLASVPVSGIPEEFRKLSRYLPVIVLVPKSA